MADMIHLERRGGFTVLPNALVTDKRLSLKTKGLMAVLLSRPDDWKYSIAGLAVFCGVGKDSIRSALAELEKAGYLTRAQIHAENGKFGGTEYTIRDHSAQPDDREIRPLSGFPTTAEPTTADPTPENPTEPNKDITQQGLNNTPYSPPRGTAGPRYKPEWFDRFWAKYPRRTDRKKAVRAWDRLRPDKRLCAVMNRALDAQMASAQWQDPDHIPHPSTWLNGRRWEDEIPEQHAPDPDNNRVEDGRLAQW